MQKMFGDPIDPIGLPESAVILHPHWQYVVKKSSIILECVEMFLRMLLLN